MTEPDAQGYDITLPNGTRIRIDENGRAIVEGELDEEVVAILHALDPDAEIVCTPKGE